MRTADATVMNVDRGNGTMEQHRRVVAGGTERSDGDDMRRDAAETSRRGSEIAQVDVRAGTVQRMRRIYESQQGTERKDASQQRWQRDAARSPVRGQRQGGHARKTGERPHPTATRSWR